MTLPGAAAVVGQAGGCNVIALSAAVLSPSTTVVPVTQSATTEQSGSSSGVSHSGKVALATVLPIVGVIAIVAAVAYYVSRRSGGAARDSGNSAVWWRRPFARSGGPASPIAGSSSSV